MTTGLTSIRHFRYRCSVDDSETFAGDLRSDRGRDRFAIQRAKISRLYRVSNCETLRHV